MNGYIHPVCAGTDCPWKNNCKRFKENIDTFHELYLSDVPFNHKTQDCEHYKGDAKLRIKNVLDRRKRK